MLMDITEAFAVQVGFGKHTLVVSAHGNMPVLTNKQTLSKESRKRNGNTRLLPPQLKQKLMSG